MTLDEAQKLLLGAMAPGVRYARVDLVSMSRVPQQLWKASIAALVDEGIVVRTGQKRGTRYQLCEGTPQRILTKPPEASVKKEVSPAKEEIVEEKKNTEVKAAANPGTVLRRRPRRSPARSTPVEPPVEKPAPKSKLPPVLPSMGMSEPRGIWRRGTRSMNEPHLRRKRKSPPPESDFSKAPLLRRPPARPATRPPVRPATRPPVKSPTEPSAPIEPPVRLPTEPPAKSATRESLQMKDEVKRPSPSKPAQESTPLSKSSEKSTEKSSHSLKLAALSESAIQILEHLHIKKPSSRSELLQKVPLSVGLWNRTIKELFATGLVLREGERRACRYFLAPDLSEKKEEELTLPQTSPQKLRKEDPSARPNNPSTPTLSKERKGSEGSTHVGAKAAPEGKVSARKKPSNLKGHRQGPARSSEAQAPKIRRRWEIAPEEILKALHLSPNVHTVPLLTSEEVPKNFWAAYSALSNTEGGVIIMGAKHRGNEMFILRGVGKIHNLIHNLLASARSENQINRRTVDRQHLKMIKIAGKEILTLFVPPPAPQERPIYVGVDAYSKNPNTGTFFFDPSLGPKKCKQEQIDEFWSEWVAPLELDQVGRKRDKSPFQEAIDKSEKNKI